jgi:hypothetical protein
VNSTSFGSLTEAKVSDGYNLAKRINAACRRTKSSKRRTKVFGVYKWGSTETCVIWKIGTTFIKRLYMMKKIPAFKNVINPYNIRFDKRFLPTASMSQDSVTSRFMFVRNPFYRLTSGYVDKLLAPNPVYWKIIGIPAIRKTRKHPNVTSLKCGHDLQFHEYVKYVIKALNPKQRSAKPDGHFDRMTSLCKPCTAHYDFVGKMESFTEDVVELGRHLKLPRKTMDIIKDKKNRFSWLDAIEDTAHQPFDEYFQKQYAHCISFKQALQRSWKKMQIRGLIGRQDFPLDEVHINNISEQAFIELAKAARFSSTSDERKQLQKEHFLQMYSKVPINDLEMISKIYESDFRIFEYDDHPSILFGDTRKSNDDYARHNKSLKYH